MTSPKKFGIKEEEILGFQHLMDARKYVLKKGYPKAEFDEIMLREKKKRDEKGNFRWSTPQTIARALFTPEVQAEPEPLPEVVRTEQRRGKEWLEVKKLIRDKYGDSEMSKGYKSIDDFATFATKEEIECLMR